MRSKGDIIKYINFLDKECIGIHPDTSLIRGMIIGLAYGINYDTKRPSCVSQEVWNKYKKEQKENMRIEKEKRAKRKRANNPQCFGDIFCEEGDE